MIQHEKKKKSYTFIMQSNLSTKTTLGSEERSRCREVAISGGSTVFCYAFFSLPKEQFAVLSSVLSFSVIQIFFNDPNTELAGFIAVFLAFKCYSFFFSL